jgi:hypothetical protein
MDGEVSMSAAISWTMAFPQFESPPEGKTNAEAARLIDGLPVPREPFTNSGKPVLAATSTSRLASKCLWLPIAPSREHESKANVIPFSGRVNSSFDASLPYF